MSGRSEAGQERSVVGRGGGERLIIKTSKWWVIKTDGGRRGGSCSVRPSQFKTISRNFMHYAVAWGKKKIDGRYRLRPPTWRLPGIGKGTLQSHTHTSSHMNAGKYSGSARSSSRPHTHAIVYLSGDDVRSFTPSPLLSVGGAGGGVGGGGWWWGRG